MAGKVIEGYFVKTWNEENGKKGEEHEVGVALNEWNAQQIIASESEWINESYVFDYGRRVLDDGVVYTNNKTGGRIWYRYEKCLIITEV